MINDNVLSLVLRRRKNYLDYCTLICDLVFFVRCKRSAHDGFLVRIHLREQQVLVLEMHVRCFRVHPISQPDT